MVGDGKDQASSSAETEQEEESAESNKRRYYSLMLLHFYTGCIFLVFYVQKLVAKVCQVQSLMIYPLCCNI